jgi:molybdenum cofactor cytidylyltransferase
MIWALILAAGESKRMGQPKLLLRYREKTIIETVVEAVLASKVHQTLVVLGSGSPEIRKKIKRYPVLITFNARFRHGMLSSVLRGIEGLPADCEAAVVVLADQPAVRAAVIDALIEAFHREKKGIVVPVYRKKRGHPFIISLKYREAIKRLDPGTGLRELLHRHPEDIHEVRISTASILGDIDTAEDYNRATKTRIL